MVAVSMYLHPICYKLGNSFIETEHYQFKRYQIG